MNHDIYKHAFKELFHGYLHGKLVQNTHTGTRDYKILDLNDEFATAFSLKREYLVGKFFSEIFLEVLDQNTVHGVLEVSEYKEFEHYSTSDQHWYNIIVLRPHDTDILLILKNITPKKRILDSAAKLLQASNKLEHDHNDIVNTVQSITGAKYVALNVYEEKGKFFRTVALNAPENHLKKAASILSFDVKNKWWAHDNGRHDKLKDKKITNFSSLRELVGDSIPKVSIQLIETIFGVGTVHVAKIEYNGTMIGDFTIMMGKGTQIQNMDLLDIYSSLIGLSITRIDAENRLAQSNVDYQQLVETSMIGVITCDLEGNIKYLNPRVLEILESPSEEETKKINLLTFEPLVNSGFSTHLKNAIMKREKVGPKEIRYHTFWGKELIAKINILPIFNENKVSGAQILIDEVTDKKQIEDLRRKEILLREIHHRVKNNLQVISSLLNMQARNFNDDAIKNAFLDSQTRVRSMSIAHEKLYGSTNLSSIEIADYIKTLQNHMLQMYRDYETEIEFKNDLDNIYLDIETTVPLGLILSELITNSLKHAFRGRKKGGISIKFKYIDNKYVLEVSDDGVGMSKSDKKDSSGSIGLMVVEMLTRQLNGVLEMNGSDGTSFKLTFNE